MGHPSYTALIAATIASLLLLFCFLGDSKLGGAEVECFLHVLDLFRDLLRHYPENQVKTQFNSYV